MLSNLTASLEKADDVEASSRDIFNLISLILTKSKHEHSLPTTTLLSFNFHRVVRVRRTLWSLLKNVLSNVNVKVSKEDL